MNCIVHDEPISLHCYILSYAFIVKVGSFELYTNKTMEKIIMKMAMSPYVKTVELTVGFGVQLLSKALKHPFSTG